MIGTSGRERCRRAHHLDELQPVHHRHFPIDEHDVGVDFLDGVKSRGAIARFVNAHDADRSQHRAHDLAHVMVVVDDQDLDRRKTRFEVPRHTDLHDAFAIKQLTKASPPCGRLNPAAQMPDFLNILDEWFTPNGCGGRRRASPATFLTFGHGRGAA
jgi:hypothetical protein